MSEQEKRLSPWMTAILTLAAVAIALSVLVNMHADAGLERAQVSEAVSLLGAAKEPLAAYFQERKKWPVKAAEAVAATSGKYTESIEITKGAGGTAAIELTATMKTKEVKDAVAGKTVRLQSSDGLTWTCLPGTVPAKYLPTACRS